MLCITQSMFQVVALDVISDQIVGVYIVEFDFSIQKKKKNVSEKKRKGKYQFCISSIAYGV